MTPPEIFKFVSDGFDEAKKGNAAEVYAKVTELHNQGLLERRSHYAYGWIIYYAMHQCAAHDIDSRKRMLARYLNLSTPRPHKLHSMILTEAIRLYNDALEKAFVIKRQSGGRSINDIPKFSIIRFSHIWDLNHLREGDWRRKENEGKLLNSTVERFIRCYVDELDSSRQPAPPAFMDIIRKAEITYSDSSSMMAQRAILHELDGASDLAVDSLRKAILLTPTKFFLWSRLARLIDKEQDVKLHIALLHRALSSPGQEEFKGKIRLSLAEAWFSIKAFSQAKYELDIIRELYQRNDWHLSPRFLEAEKSIPSDTVAANPEAAYRRIAPLADDFIFSAIPEIEAVKSFHKEAAPDRFNQNRMQPVAWRVTDENQNNYWFTPTKFNINENLPVGTPVFIKTFNGKIVKART